MPRVTYIVCTALLLCRLLPGQAASGTAAGQNTVKAAHTSLYLAAPAIDFTGVVPPPPAVNSPAGVADLRAVHDAEVHRTRADVLQAQQDDAEEDIFLYAPVLGGHFNAAELPLTAVLGAHVRSEAATVTPALKTHYARPRPFVADSTVHPVCEQKREPSYPSGHAMVGYLEALTVAQMVPERAVDILARADAYAHNRIVCGVHYPSDIAASRTAALVEFGALSGSVNFRAELARARVETRKALAFPE